MTLRSWWRRISGAELRDQRAYIDRCVQSAPTEDAIRQVESALLQGEKFHVVANEAGTMPLNGSVPELVGRLFRRYSVINTLYSDVTISHELCRPTNLLPAFVKIGEHTAHDELLVKHDDDRLYVFDGGDGDPFEDSYPSVYHYLLSIIAIVHPELVSLWDPRF